MNAVNEYARQVMDLIPPAHPERDRIELDLRAHLEETVAELEGSPSAAFDRMGDPREVALAYLAEIPMRYAGVGRRVLAFFIDMLAGLAVLGTVAIMVLLVFGVLAVAEETTRPGPPEMSLALLAVTGIAFVLSLALLSIAYFPVLEWRFGQTLGKYLLGIYVVREDGLRPSLPATIVRRIPFFLEFFWIDAIVAFFTERNQRAFDLVAGTVVVENRTNA
jgi:uncharacterized RDD family membrane protein YckC